LGGGEREYIFSIILPLKAARTGQVTDYWRNLLAVIMNLWLL